MSTVIKAAGPARFLSLVPHLLGFHPTRSLVLVPFSGRRSVGAMRFDLPSAAGADDVERIASTCIGMVCRLPDANAVALVVYTDDSLHRADDSVPHRAFVRAIAARADACGIEVRDALCVGADAWTAYPDDGAAPRLGDLSEVAAPAADDLPPVRVGDQAAGAELPAVADEAAQPVAAALRALDQAVRTVCADVSAEPGADERAIATLGRLDPHALTAACRLDELPALFEDVLAWDPSALAPFDAATLIWCLARPALRDIALVQWCGTLADGEAALDAQLQWEGGADYPADLGMRMWGEGTRPDRDRLSRALELARHAAALAPDAVRPGAPATCAWLSWALGRSTHAESFARRACELEPEHGLGEIVRSFVAVGHVPDWAFRAETGGRGRR
ncbi:DUF4192 family protein [Microbacterium sp.]|uniref:DUF4192 family protein n=1 Tax=Microbacterium sp. TaxID=51671 RepID=UPI001AD1AC0B|nr:DUF4192 family protein [Microbacterium sp.]MBN9192491.1 DUF4192 family protein [Microbacterium sp.]